MQLEERDSKYNTLVSEHSSLKEKYKSETENLRKEHDLAIFEANMEVSYGTLLI